ncbi:MAG: GNAT family N-acetyltransferase [Sandaracinaceae bacterium]
MLIELLQPDEWRRMKTMRLEALADAPEAFLRTWDEERAYDDATWIDRMGGSVAHFVARHEDRDVGLVVGAPYDDDLGLFGMWVHPAARGQGAGDGLVEAVVGWAAASEAARLLLDVADENQPAIALYARHRFEPTGITSRLPPPRAHILEHQRARRLP